MNAEITIKPMVVMFVIGYILYFIAKEIIAEGGWFGE